MYEIPQARMSLKFNRGIDLIYFNQILIYFLLLICFIFENQICEFFEKKNVSKMTHKIFSSNEYLIFTLYNKSR